MGLLTTEQIASIRAGTMRVRQQWWFYYPSVQGGSPDVGFIIHDGLTKNVVVDAGSRQVESYNNTLMEPGKLRIKNYEFTVQNDGYYSYNRPGSIWEQLGRMMDPVECGIKHQLFFQIPGEAEELFTGADFFGSIIGLEYTSGGRSDGTSMSSLLKFVCNNDVITKIMDRTWSSSDGLETDLSHQIMMSGD